MGGLTRRARRAAAVLLGAAALAAGACNPAPVTVVARALAPIGRNEIQRIAVVPFATGELVGAAAREEGQEPLAEPPAATVERAVREAMLRLPSWEVADDLLVAEALRKLLGEIRAPTTAEAAAVGELLGVDAVVRGQVTAFEDRIGAEYAAKRPARVDFGVELVRVPGGVVVWQAAYAEQQRALLDNLWNLYGFLRTRGRWVRAGTLATIGAQQLVGRLHQALYGVAATPRSASAPSPARGVGRRRRRRRGGAPPPPRR